MKTQIFIVIDKYNENRFSNDIISAVKKIPNIVKILPRLLNSTEESLVKAYRSIKNSPKIKPLANSYSYIKGYIVRSSPKISDQDKQNNPNYKSAYAPVDKLVPTTQILNKRFEKLQIIQDAKVARKALKLLKKVKSPKDMERFVKKYQGLISEKDDEKKS